MASGEYGCMLCGGVPGFGGSGDDEFARRTQRRVCRVCRRAFRSTTGLYAWAFRQAALRPARRDGVRERVEEAVVIRAIARYQFLYDIGANVTSKAIGIVNTSLLLAGLGSPWWLIALVALAYVLGTPALGWWLDRHKYLDHMTDEGNKRNSILRALGPK